MVMRMATKKRRPARPARLTHQVNIQVLPGTLALVDRHAERACANRSVIMRQLLTEARERTGGDPAKLPRTEARAIVGVMVDSDLNEFLTRAADVLGKRGPGAAATAIIDSMLTERMVRIEGTPLDLRQDRGQDQDS